MVTIPVSTEAFTMPDMVRMVKKFGTKSEKRTKATAKVRSGPAIGDTPNRRRASIVQAIAELLIYSTSR
jgi:hypothetical protein